MEKNTTDISQMRKKFEDFESKITHNKKNIDQGRF